MVTQKYLSQKAAPELHGEVCKLILEEIKDVKKQ